MLQRLIFERIEQRIVVGTIAFLGIMILVGWVAINEGGRMQAFDRQFNARSIERGAALFNALCSTCHGTDGRGSARAPALNSPYLFGHGYLADLDSQIAALNLEYDNTATTPERITEIEAQVATINQERDARIAQMQGAIDKGYDPTAPSRLANVGWVSSLHNFIYTALNGRPVSRYYWPQPMVAWAQTAGGPLRNDELEDLTQYVLNWDKGSNWTIEDLLAVNQFPINPVDPATVVTTSGADPVIGSSTAIADVMVGLADIQGDPQAGQTLYNGALACAGCHANGAVAPTVEGTWTRVQEVRLLEAQFAGYTGEEYLAESITHPNEYISPGYGANIMPPNFADRLTYQQLGDMVAYLKSHDEPLP